MLQLQSERAMYYDWKLAPNRTSGANRPTRGLWRSGDSPSL